MKAPREEICFVTSCDAPFLNLRLNELFRSKAEGYQSDVMRILPEALRCGNDGFRQKINLTQQVAGIVPQRFDRLLPLSVQRSRSTRCTVKQGLAVKAASRRGILGPTLPYEKVQTRIFSEDEVRRADPQGLRFINLNTPGLSIGKPPVAIPPDNGAEAGSLPSIEIAANNA